MAVCLLYSTHPSAEQARDTAALLLSESLAACCNILPHMESHYVWENKTEHTMEVVMLTKTTDEAAATAIEVIVGHHPYETPAVLKLPVTAGNPEFLRWITESCG